MVVRGSVGMPGVFIAKQRSSTGLSTDHGLGSGSEHKGAGRALHCPRLMGRTLTGSKGSPGAFLPLACRTGPRGLEGGWG